MSITTIMLLLTAASALLWMRRIMRFVFGISRAVSRRPAKQAGPSFEERLEARLADLAAGRPEPGAADPRIETPVVPPLPPRPSGFGRKRS